MVQPMHVFVVLHINKAYAVFLSICIHGYTSTLSGAHLIFNPYLYSGFRSYGLRMLSSCCEDATLFSIPWLMRMMADDDG